MDGACIFDNGVNVESIGFRFGYMDKSREEGDLQWVYCGVGMRYGMKVGGTELLLGRLSD
jgi:hypothetical protein